MVKKELGIFLWPKRKSKLFYGQKETCQKTSIYKKQMAVVVVALKKMKNDFISIEQLGVNLSFLHLFNSVNSLNGR
jgi:hypothetical protein